MPDRDDIVWFKKTFGDEINTALQGTAFSIDLLAALASQETGYIWGTLRKTLDRGALLELCVGDTLDEDRGRRAFPRNKAQLIAAPQGQTMFDIAHDALVKLGASIPSYRAVAKNRDKFCHGYGIFQMDLQFFKTDPDFFLQKQWTNFNVCLKKCLAELQAAAGRIGLGQQKTLSDLDQVHIAIAYNSGSFKPAKGLKQGYFDGTQFYGERIFDLLRLAQTAGTASVPAALPQPAPGTAAIALPTSIGGGKTFEVNVLTTPLRLRSEPRIDKEDEDANVMARLPDGHLVRLVSGKLTDKFVEVETSLNGAYLHGFAASQYLLPVKGTPEIPVASPSLTPPSSGIVAVYAPRKAGSVTKRTAVAGAQSLNEPNLPGRTGTTPQELRQELAVIIDYLAVDKPAHVRYQPRAGLTFCNIYAHDYCYLAGVYLPRVWWTPDAIERLAQGQTVEPRLDATIDEQRANDLLRWLRAFGERFGWRQTGTLTKLQTEVNAGAVGLIVARRKVDGKSGHIVAVVPETDSNQARRDASGEVIACLQSQAGASNFRYGTGKVDWWKSAEFADSGFWIHA